MSDAIPEDVERNELKEEIPMTTPKTTWRKTRVTRIIDTLRRKYPGTWRYNGPHRTWLRKEDGAEARWVSVLTPRYDGDDDTFTSELRIYPSGELVLP